MTRETKRNFKRIDLMTRLPVSECDVPIELINKIKKRTKRSSTIRIPMMTDENGASVKFSSSKNFATTIVEVTLVAAPMSMPTVSGRLKKYEMIGPIENKLKFFISVIIIAVEPTFRSFLNVKLKPNVKRRKMTPNSAQMSIDDTSVTVGKKGKFGLTKKPAKRYPKIRGCFNNLQKRIVKDATSIIRARSKINGDV